MREIQFQSAKLIFLFFVDFCDINNEKLKFSVIYFCNSYNFTKWDIFREN